MLHASAHDSAAPDRISRAGWRIVLLASLGGTLEFYDFVIFAWGATYLAGGIAFVLWLGMIRHVRRHVRAARLRAPIAP